MLKEIYKNHSGKVSDKWSIYLDKCEEKLNPFQKLPEEELVLLKKKNEKKISTT